MATHTAYPVHVAGALDPRLSRWLWLVKWLLAVPHYIVLAFLWLGFVALSVVAFFAILFTGRYPRAVFDYNVGVLRWTWRVMYYAYGALGTDRYPPFTLQDVPDYPARLSVDYPQHLSRGLVLVKWWLLAIPHYIIVGFFVGGGTWFASRSDANRQWSWGGGGLVGILVLVAAVILAFTGSYPRSLFELILGMNRWALRVAGYAALMTDEYPPFRLDLGGDDPSAMTLVAAGPPAPRTGLLEEPGPTASQPGGQPPAPPAGGGHWTAGRVVTLVIGAAVAFASVGLLTAGIGLAVAGSLARDDAGYLSTPTVTLSSPGYAIASSSIALEGGGPSWALPPQVLGTTRIHVSATDPGQSAFVGVAPTRSVETYLTGVRHATVESIGGNGRTRYSEQLGGAPSTPPTQLGIWTAQASGTGPLTLAWTPTAGDWTLVVMNAAATPGVSIRADAGATVPHLGWIATALTLGGIALLALATLLIIIPIQVVSRHQNATQPARVAPHADQT